ncbi:expressed unknown protein [Seminavis robusta]|uniref:Glycosyltransferase 2-like domain-containing protein n=1 Tax=Seminavis robusta TaxID=568900 RepID=A0A9N8DVP0_9STRA|nr:expressed unknown protein [Seminavis robusta]|eukprot:Sro280_g107080.1 n/a (863) ;mRNA; f:53035-55894
MSESLQGNKQRVCIVNVGLYRSGTTYLAEASKSLGLKPYRTFPELTSDEQKKILQDPKKAVLDWFSNDGLNQIIHLATEYDLLCDGWVALLSFLPPSLINSLKAKAQDSGVSLELVASTRDVESTVKSELHHWVIHDLEKRAALNPTERTSLENLLRERAKMHYRSVQCLCQLGMLKLLPLEDGLEDEWPKVLSPVDKGFVEEDWASALRSTEKQNVSPPLPVEGILLTLRFGSDPEAVEKIASIERLLDQIEEDSLCQYLVVLAVDNDEANGDAAGDLIKHLKSRERKSRQLQKVHTITNPPRNSQEPFPICSIWNEMATVAWASGADWVELLGDDIGIDCPFHYRAFYRAFLDISERLMVPFGFGCPWWNDRTFPGFPSFPCVGKTHQKIFGGLIPKQRGSSFINQDLDPYLHRMYQKSTGAPCVKEAVLSNRSGGNISSNTNARYERICAKGSWQDFAVDDLEKIRQHLPIGVTECFLLDVVVPSYRVRLDYLESICSLRVPEFIQSLFIIIVDNRSALSGNTVRVRCNEKNVGASASRNRGLDESAAEFVLNLDDDLIPNPDLLEQYGRALQNLDDDVVGLIGLVRFPRSPTLPLRHAAVLMSYLTFMFEIAEQGGMYQPATPAWGVTANILFRRTRIRFDLAYAKTGGGEDVDFSLRVSEASGGGHLVPVPEACVVHPFWPGSVLALASHFFNWAIGDGALFSRFPRYRYWSFPNLPESLFLSLPLFLWLGPLRLFTVIPYLLVADFAVDFCNQTEFNHRCLLLDRGQTLVSKRSYVFYFAAHVLGNIYVVVLESGRLWGHICRNELLTTGLFRRFDWHCGRLQAAPSKFRQREAAKFGLFVSVLVYNLVASSKSSI